MSEKDQTTFDQLCAFVEKTMKQKGVPGVAVGVLCDGQIDTAGFGVTNVDSPLPVTDETLFQIGSISKTFTCLAVMRLVEEGKLDLHARCRLIYPGFEWQTKRCPHRSRCGICSHI
jgi:CubicO group peptidase (beta-lactamase class C family)